MNGAEVGWFTRWEFGKRSHTFVWISRIGGRLVILMHLIAGGKQQLRQLSMSRLTKEQQVMEARWKSLNKVTTRWEAPQSLSYHKQSLGNEKRWASLCTLISNKFFTSNQSYVHSKIMLLNEFIVLIRRGDDISSCFHLKDDLKDTRLRWVLTRVL